MTRLDEQYDDLLDGQDDPAARRLIAALDASLRPPVPGAARVEVARALREQARQAPRRAWPRRRVLLVAAAVAVAALVTGSALAASPLADDVALWFNNGDVPAASGPAHSGPDQTPPLGTLGTPMRLARTVCGYTVTLDRLYADVNRVSAGYTLTWPAFRHFKDVDIRPALTDAHGASLPMYNGASDLPKGNTNWNATIFDASSVATTTAPLALRMTIPTINLLSAVKIPHPAPCERVGRPQPDPGLTGGTVYPVTVTGPFTFDVTAPVTTSLRTVNVNQTLTSSHGTSVTLERIVLTPTEARMYYRGPAEMFLAGGAPTLPELYVDGKEIDGIIGKPLGDGRWSYSFGNWGVNLYRDHSAWSFKVLTDPTMTDYRRAWSDSVTFHVTVP